MGKHVCETVLRGEVLGSFLCGPWEDSHSRFRRVFLHVCAYGSQRTDYLKCPIPQEPSILVLETESLIGLILFIWLKSLGSEARGPAGLCLHSVLLSGVWE